jgi:hypothetical protein
LIEDQRTASRRPNVRPPADGHRLHPFILPVPGKDLPGVLAYRDIADTEAMIDAAAKSTGTRWSSAAACWGWRPPTA